MTLKKEADMKKILSFLFIIILFGCSSKPSENDARAVVQNIMKKSNSEQYLKLVSFDKSNGSELEISGQKIYKMDIEIEVEVTRECEYNDRLNARAPQPRAMLQFIWTPTRQPGYKSKFQDVIAFQKTEKGWLGPDGELY